MSRGGVVGLAAATAVAVVDGHALVVDSGRIYDVDLASGDRTIVSDLSRGSGPALAHLQGLALDGARALVVGEALGQVSNWSVDRAPAIPDPRQVSIWVWRIVPNVRLSC